MFVKYKLRGIRYYVEYVRAFIHILLYSYKKRFIKIYELNDKNNIFLHFKFYCIPSLIKRGLFIKNIFGCVFSGKKGLEYLLKRYINFCVKS